MLSSSVVVVNWRKDRRWTTAAVVVRKYLIWEVQNSNRPRSRCGGDGCSACSRRPTRSYAPPNRETQPSGEATKARAIARPFPFLCSSDRSDWVDPRQTAVWPFSHHHRCRQYQPYRWADRMCPRLERVPSSLPKASAFRRRGCRRLGPGRVRVRIR